MLLMFLSYILISILVAAFFYWKKEFHDGDGIILSIFWPLTLTLVIYILISIEYKEYVGKRIIEIMSNGTINDCSLKELKYITYGEKIGAYYLTDDVKKQILKNIENSSFEEVFLKQ
jgi:hypothetical protein